MGNIIASRLEASEQIGALLNALFAIEGKVKPYYKYLEWELNTHKFQHSSSYFNSKGIQKSFRGFRKIRGIR